MLKVVGRHPKDEDARLAAAADEPRELADADLDGVAGGRLVVARACEDGDGDERKRVIPGPKDLKGGVPIIRPF